MIYNIKKIIIIDSFEKMWEINTPSLSKLVIKIYQIPTTYFVSLKRKLFLPSSSAPCSSFSTFDQ